VPKTGCIPRDGEDYDKVADVANKSLILKSFLKVSWVLEKLKVFRCDWDSPLEKGAG